MVLKPEEIWDHAKFGFSSPTELAAVVGAYLRKESLSHPLREGYKWATRRDDGSEIITEVTGNGDSDLRIYQTDTTPYLTTDPFRDQIGMRPEMDADRHTIAAYHSTEATLMVAVMKYVEQQGIETEYQKDNSRQLIDWGRSLGQGGRTCAEHFGGFDQEPMMFFVEYGFPIPQLNEANKSEEHPSFGLGTLMGGWYGIYIAHNGDLILSYLTQEKMKDPVKQISARFLPGDAEHLVRGLIYQAAAGLGRTSARQLLDLLDYRYSAKFKHDQKKIQEKLGS